MTLNFRTALPDDVPAVMALYSSLVGTEGCTWNEYYPDYDIVSVDARDGRLFCAEYGNEIVAAAAYDVTDDLFDLDIWKCGENKKPAALMRVGVKKEFQRHGIAGKLLLYVISYLNENGYGSLRLLVSPGNVAANRLYSSFGFVTRGETELYGQHWLCMEKSLARNRRNNSV